MEQWIYTCYHTAVVCSGAVAGVEGAGAGPGEGGAGGEGQDAALLHSLGMSRRGRACPPHHPRCRRSSRTPHGLQCRCPR